MQLGLWGETGETDARAGRAMVRVQALLGPDSVVTAALVGGREPGDQVRLVPWGDERPPDVPAVIGGPVIGGPVIGVPEPTTGPVTPGGSETAITGQNGSSHGAGASEPDTAPHRPDHAAPAGWPDDVLRATGRTSAADLHGADGPMRPRPTSARRRLPGRGAAAGRGRPVIRDPPPSWPGQMPAPSPATVPPAPLPAELLDAAGRPVMPTAPDLLTAAPHRIAVDGGSFREVTGWAGPWPLAQRWWVPGAVAGSRLQVALDDGTALLLLSREGWWWVTGVYD